MNDFRRLETLLSEAERAKSVLEREIFWTRLEASELGTHEVRQALSDLSVQLVDMDNKVSKLQRLLRELRQDASESWRQESANQPNRPFSAGRTTSMTAELRTWPWQR